MKRLKTILKWTLIALGGLAAILLVANALFVWTTDTRLERQLAEIRQSGDPLTLADLARPPIPPEKNAATYLRRAEADLQAIFPELDDVPGLSEPPYQLSPAAQEKIKAALNAYPNAIPLLEQAAACPDYDIQIDYSAGLKGLAEAQGPIMQNLRAAARVLRARGMLLIAVGDRDGAVQTSLVALRLARLFERNPMMIWFFTASAARGVAEICVTLALQGGPVSKEVRDALDAELAQHECTDTHVGVIKGERASDLDGFRSTEVFPFRNFWLLNRGLWNCYESDYLDAVQTFLALARGTGFYREDEQAIRKLAAFQPYLAMQRDGMFGQIIQKTCNDASFFAISEITNLQGLHQSVARNRARIRCLRILNAIQNHVSAGGDEVPKLTELGLPAETTTDPYNGEPLHVKKTLQGWLVYSVGANFKDDGGNFDDNLDVGVGPLRTDSEPVEK